MKSNKRSRHDFPRRNAVAMTTVSRAAKLIPSPHPSSTGNNKTYPSYVKCECTSTIVKEIMYTTYRNCLVYLNDFGKISSVEDTFSEGDVYTIKEVVFCVSEKFNPLFEYVALVN